MSDFYTGITVFGLNDIAGNSAIGTPGSPFPAAAVQIAGSDGTDLRVLSTTANGYLNVNASITPPSDNTASATFTTTAATLPLSTEGTSALMVQLDVTTALESGASIDFQVSLDGGTSWHAAQLYPIPTIGGQESSPSVSSLTGPQPTGFYNYTLPVGGIQQFRLLTAGTWTTSVVAATITAGQGQYSVFNYSDNQANFLATTYQGGTWTVQQGGAPWSQNLTEVGGAAITLGQKTSAASIPVVIASDQSAVPVSQSGAPWSVTISGQPISTTDNVTQWASTTLGAPTAWGTAPTGNIIGVNSEIFVGNNPVSATAPVPISATAAANTSGNPIFVSAAITGTVTVVGNLTNNNAAPAANNVGVLGYIATATPEAYTQGDQVLATTSLGGAVRTVPVDEANASSLSYYSFDSGNSETSVSTTLIPIISIETNSAGIIFLLRGITAAGNGAIALIRVVKNGTLTGATFAGTEGSMKTDTAATAISAGTTVWSGYVGATFLYQSLLQAIAAGTPGDKFTIAAQSISGSAKVTASIQWSEQSAAL